MMPPSTGEITAVQQRALDVILAHLRDRGYPPTPRELAHRLGVTADAVREVLAALERKRVLRVVPWDARTLIVMEGAS